jgi:hypothetical protein
MIHLDRQHTILVDGAVDRVFPLFTPIGETYWVDGWDPEFIYPESGETREGMVFRTSHGGEETLWSCLAWEPGRHHVRYARVTPGSRFGFVEVNCLERSADQTEASVRYTLTALSAEGASQLSDLTAEAYQRMIDEWRTRIGLWLASNPETVIS